MLLAISFAASISLGISIGLDIGLVATALLGGMGIAIYLRFPSHTRISIPLLAPWIVRPFTNTGLLPRPFDFIEFPLVFLALATSILSAIIRGDARAGLDRVAVAILFAPLLFAVTSVSSGVSVIRTFSALALLFLPFFLLTAYLIDPPSQEGARKIAYAAGFILVLQVPVSLMQRAVIGHTDAMVGTLIGADAGHHVMPSVLVVGMFAAFSRFKAPLRRLLMAIVVISILILSDAKAPLLLLPIAGIAFSYIERRSAAGGAVRSSGTRTRNIALIVAAVVAVSAYPATQTAVGYVREAASGDRGKIVVAQGLWNDLTSSPVAMTLGFGAGHTISRFAALVGPGAETGSPARTLGLMPSPRAARYELLATGGHSLGSTSSFHAPTSSFGGVLGDYGIIGLSIYCSLVALLLIRIVKSRSPHSAAAVTAWVVAIPLGAAFDWLEQPAFMLFVAVLTGLALNASEPRDVGA